MAAIVGICPKCGIHMKLTKHHVLPKRHFGRRGQLLHICRDCHSALEEWIPATKVLEDIEYYKIVVRFLNRKERL